MDIDALLLETLRTVAQERSVPRAAAALHVHRTVISRRLSLLEGRLGIELVQGGGGELILTPAAQILVAESERMHEHGERAVNRARRAAARFATPSRTLSIAVLDGRISPELAALRAALTSPARPVHFRRYPYADLLETVRDGRCELAVTWLPISETALRGLRAAVWRRFPRVVLAPADHQLAAASSCLLSHLANQPLVGFDIRLDGRAASYWTLGRHRDTRRSGAGLLRCRSQHLAEHYELVAAGVALAVAPAPLADPDDPRYVAVPVRDLSPATRLIVWNAAHEHRLAPLVRRFVATQEPLP
ncbi:LysR family transcriptional regulator [Micromonospora sp. R77]|uniref:LysR family transcriptional regulator n=1 Tax=Micromonospora sp. R77 TaxID=2925836 RepID=UPI001F6112C2|nr:LysR family transcriptional regulator [Micromonospora sp. R77]MCI4066030.1 LysR family transcriptional regulator [Micromonospora sp. R77]